MKQHFTHLSTGRVAAPPREIRPTDNLDRLLGLLERARAEQAERDRRLAADPVAPYRGLLVALKGA